MPERHDNEILLGNVKMKNPNTSKEKEKDKDENLQVDPSTIEGEEDAAYNFYIEEIKKSIIFSVVFLILFFWISNIISMLRVDEEVDSDDDMNNNFSSYSHNNFDKYQEKFENLNKVNIDNRNSYKKTNKKFN